MASDREVRMMSAFGAALHVLLTALGLGAMSDPTAVALAAAAVAALACVLVATLGRTGVPSTAGRSRAHPQRSIDPSIPLAQSDPDAAGHPRPRAPGVAAAAA